MSSTFGLSFGSLTFAEKATIGSLTAPASQAKSGYAQLIASTAKEATYIGWRPSLVDNGPYRYAVDLAVGASGSEQIVLPDLLSISGAYTRRYFNEVFLPCTIPAGTRIAARLAASSQMFSAGNVGELLLYHGTFGNIAGGARVVTYGGMLGTNVASGNTWTQMAASTSVFHRGFYVVCSHTDQLYHGLYEFDVGIGASGSEVQFGPTISFAMRPYWGGTPGYWLFPMALPAGTRIAIRVRFTAGTDASSGNLYFGLIGF